MESHYSLGQPNLFVLLSIPFSAEKEYENTPCMAVNIRTCLEMLLEALFFSSNMVGCSTLVSK